MLLTRLCPRHKRHEPLWVGRPASPSRMKLIMFCTSTSQVRAAKRSRLRQGLLKRFRFRLATTRLPPKCLILPLFPFTAGTLARSGASSSRWFPAQAARASLGGQTGITVENETNYVLYLYLSGPSSQEITLAAGASQTLQVSPGDYEIAAKVSDPSVIPFYGRDTCTIRSFEFAVVPGTSGTSLFGWADRHHRRE